ncbi:hypothetical protein CCP1ISM_90002 [Azospirillaceae bacterium]
MNRHSMMPYPTPFGNNGGDNYDAVQAARQMRQKSKIPRIRTMKKILKKIKDVNNKSKLKVVLKEAEKKVEDTGPKTDV